MKRILLMIVVLMLCIAAVACGPSDTAEPTPAATPLPASDTTPSPTPAATPIPTPEPPRSFTTGLEYDGAYRPVLVTIENSAAARPQTGLQTADVVYEVPVEGGITRFVCVFSDNAPEEVTPVRSARVPFLYIVREWDGAFMHYGGSGSGGGQQNEPFSVYGHELYDDITINVDGLLGSYNDYFYRTSDRQAPHNVVGNPQMVQALYDYEPQPLGWLFDSEAAYTGESVTEISLPMCSGQADYVSYTYDAASGSYLRFMGGKEFISAETDAQVTVTNVIVQYSSYTVSNGVKLWKMTGSGAADIYIGGVRIEGTWEKASATDPTVFYDAEGNQIVLHPGNTWIHIHPED